jgi:hypothetical protein
MQSTFNVPKHGHELLDEIELIARNNQQVLRSLEQNEKFSPKVRESMESLSILLNNTRAVGNIIEHMDGEYRSLFKNLLKRHREEVAFFRHANLAQPVEDLAVKNIEEDDRELEETQHILKEFENRLGIVNSGPVQRITHNKLPYHGYPTTEYYLNYNDYPQY